MRRHLVGVSDRFLFPVPKRNVSFSHSNTKSSYLDRGGQNRPEPARRRNSGFAFRLWVPSPAWCLDELDKRSLAQYERSNATNVGTRLTVAVSLARGSCRGNRRESRSHVPELWHQTKSDRCRSPSLRGRCGSMGWKVGPAEVRPSWEGGIWRR